jgi:hypothetical protein
MFGTLQDRLIKELAKADGALAVFHGPRCIARYTEDGAAIAAAPTKAAA